MTLDHINAVFEGGSALFIASNVRRLYIDKKLSGVNVATTAWFSVWGFWNLFYYFGLAQWFSWAMGAFVFLANTTWVILALAYRRRAGSIEVDGLPMEDDDLPYVSIDKADDKRSKMELSRAKIDEWPTLPDELTGFKPGEVAELSSRKTRISDDDLAALFEKRLDTSMSTKRKAMVVRPDIPRLDVRTLTRLPSEITEKMETSRAKLAADTGEVDE